MVQYIFTPWRDRRELLAVRQQFYPAAAAQTEPAIPGGEKNGEAMPKAVARVSMWMQRGNCPHMVESTALLTAAILSDQEAATMTSSGAAGCAVRAAYSAAFSRFVTGLLDSHQDKQRKLSMYALAKRLGLPATFVELRHQATHEQLPSLTRLRTAAHKALAWIWEYYWKHLSSDGDNDDEGSGSGSGNGSGDRACRAVLMRYLSDEEDDQAAWLRLEKQMRRWEETFILRLLADIAESAVDNRVTLRCLRLSRRLMSTTDGEGGNEQRQRDVEQIKAELAEARAELQRLEEKKTRNSAADLPMGDTPDDEVAGTGWSEYQGVWRPKPIGVV